GDLPGGGGLGARRRRGSFRVDASDPPLSRMVPSCPLVGHAPGPGARRQGGTPSWQQRFAGPVRGALLTTCRALARLVARGRPDPAANLRIQVDKPRFSEEIGERPAALSTIGTRALHLRVGPGASSCRAPA